nr:unnamed protein product [Naegleria fowleri]
MNLEGCELVIATIMESKVFTFVNPQHHYHHHLYKEYYYFNLLLKEKHDAFMKLMERHHPNFGSLLRRNGIENNDLLVDDDLEVRTDINFTEFYELFTIEMNETNSSSYDDELINSMTCISLRDENNCSSFMRRRRIENKISVIYMKINLKQEVMDEGVVLLVHDILKPVKLFGIDTLSIRDFAEFRESSIKFLINFQANQFLSNHVLFQEFQNSNNCLNFSPDQTCSFKDITPKKSMISSPQKALISSTSPLSPSSTEVKSSSARTNSSVGNHGYVDISIDCLNIIIEIKHIHLGYVSFSREGFLGIGDESLAERVSFQKRENKEPLGDLLDIIDETPAAVMWETWSVARLASVYNQQRNAFPAESFKFSKHSTPQTYYFEPIENILREAQEQVLKYQPSNNDLRRVLLVSIGRRLFYQIVTRNTDWRKLTEIKCNI